ncbi:MAG: hypothetical protein ACREHG_10420 [Candidatus Saccharimonadales bacterium]
MTYRGCGPDDSLKLMRNGVTIWVKYWPEDKSGGEILRSAYVGIDLRIPLDKEIKINLSKARIASSGNSLKSDDVQVRVTTPGVRVHTLNVAKGKILHFDGGGYLPKKFSLGYSEFFISFWLKHAASQEFYFFMPGMNISGSKFSGITVRFERTKGNWIAGASCP